MSHHFDSAADRADGRINPCDLYAFPGAPGTTLTGPVRAHKLQFMHMP